MKLVSEKHPVRVWDQEAAERLQGLVRLASIEATPRQILNCENLPGLLPTGTCVYVPFLPKGQFSDTLEACRHLQTMGMQPIPHVPARMAESHGQMRDWLSQLHESGVDRFFQTTDGWDAPILNDRRAPIYPRHQHLTTKEMGLVDTYLRNLGASVLTS